MAEWKCRRKSRCLKSRVFFKKGIKYREMGNYRTSKYSVFILPLLTTIKRGVAEKVKYFFDNSGIVITLNMLPMNLMGKGENDGYVISIFSKILGFDPRAVRIGYFEMDSAFRREHTVNTNSNGICLIRKGFLF